MIMLFVSMVVLVLLPLLLITSFVRPSIFKIGSRRIESGKWSHLEVALFILLMICVFIMVFFTSLYSDSVSEFIKEDANPIIFVPEGHTLV